MEEKVKQPLFTNKQLAALIIPIIIEQTLAVTVGMADTIMVAGAGEEAVSGISLVNQMNMLLIQVFSAMAAGGTVVVSQFLGRRDYPQAKSTAIQLLWFVFAISFTLAVVTFTLNEPILQLIYGHIEPGVMAAACTYFYLTAVSFPFLAIYNVSASLFRVMGNSKISMYTSFVMNVINIVGNAIFIFGLQIGVAGAGLATLLSRAAAAVFITMLLLKKSCPVSIWGFWKPKFSRKILLAIMRMGIPNGIEGGMYKVGKLLVSRLVSSFGTASITANAIAGDLDSMITLTAQSIGISMLTVVGQSVGARDPENAKRYTYRLLGLSYIGLNLMSLIVFLLKPFLIGMYGMSEEINALTNLVINYFMITAAFFWPLSFALPNALRGAGDARFTMVVSMISMWLCRIVAAHILGGSMGLGLLGVYIGMSLDWMARGVCFLLRTRGKKWLSLHVID